MPSVEQHGNRRWLGIFLLIAAFVVIIDQISKLWIRTNLDLNEIIPIVDRLSLTYIHNTGSAFGLFAGQSFLLALISFVGLIAIMWFHHYLYLTDIWGNLALGLVFGGAIGNLIDRLRFGRVTDFIYVRLWYDSSGLPVYWPTFNFADSAITAGCIALICYLIFAFKKVNVHPGGNKS